MELLLLFGAARIVFPRNAPLRPYFFGAVLQGHEETVHAICLVLLNSRYQPVLEEYRRVTHAWNRAFAQVELEPVDAKKIEEAQTYFDYLRQLDRWVLGEGPCPMKNDRLLY